MPKVRGTKVTLRMARGAVRTTLEGRRRLILANMGIVDFPKCVLKLGNIDELDLSRNRIEKIPNHIGDIQSLKVLDLHSNRLQSVSEAMGNLKNLEYLNLSNNFINTLPSTVGSLTKLKVFNIGMNKLDCLPTSMEKLQNLEELRLFDNQFKTLPNFVNNLPSLMNLNLTRNPVSLSQGDNTKLPENRVYLVHENNLCQTCLRNCQLHKQKSVIQGGRKEGVEEKVLKGSRFAGLMAPNSMAKSNQNEWRIRKVF
ncbi:uncharacterized protein lrrc18a [Eucyclogobius newberryi]|uniref:uncharacterized protein lrrc18a n=1 Tax=Eucyclogobius newberryi TaxID=166745 RepID=UPI003B5B2272